MMSNHRTPGVDAAHHLDREDQDLWISPSRHDARLQPRVAKDSNTSSKFIDLRNEESTFEKGEAKKEALQRELESVRKVNDAIEGVIESLERAKSNMKTVNATVHSASTLLNTWTRILSQTEHAQRLTLNVTWQGASQDISDMEQEATARQQAAMRMEAEEQEKKEAAAEKAKDEERKKAEAATRGSHPPSRGRGRGYGRGSSTVSSTATGYVGVGGQSGSKSNTKGSNTETRRGPSHIVRGTVSSRGRGKGS